MAELFPVPVPEKVARHHLAARQFRERSERHEVSRALIRRATRIIHVIASEAERRGWGVSVASESTKGPLAWSAAKHGHLQITTEAEPFWLRLHEHGVHTRGPWNEEVEGYRNVSRDWSWYRDRELPSGPYDADSSGQLKLELFCAQPWIFSGRQSRWSDRQSWQLEHRLSHLFREIAERAVEAKRVAEEKRIAAERAAEDAKREAEERERQWHVLMEQAKRGSQKRTTPTSFTRRPTPGIKPSGCAAT